MKLTGAPTFIVDPIDGTVNFVHAFPNVCISLGFTVEKIPMVGVVYNPFTKILYSAMSGCGAYMTYLGETRKLPLKAKPEPLQGLQKSLVSIEWGSDRDGNNWDVKFTTFRKLAASRSQGGAMVHSLRSMGSAALNLCSVATGTIDVYWEGGCWAWDVAAGWVILKEAGGMVVDGNPGNWKPEVDGRRYMAVRAAPSGTKELVEEFWNVIGDGRFDYSS